MPEIQEEFQTDSTVSLKKTKQVERIDLDKVMNRIGDYTIAETGQVMPLYELKGFINTLEGWNMFVAAGRGEVSQEDYETAKKAYNEGA